MEKKNKALLAKYNTYKTNVENSYQTYPGSPSMLLPTFEEVKAFEIADVFWNMGHLTHPDEPWAVNLSTQSGIQAF
ncbi:hypothetical protein DFH28DRAFT_888967 [Melampsora americana]|nr:hypothetical protein DFH28DRAFT_888967 [Melampsora americana]